MQAIAFFPSLIPVVGSRVGASILSQIMYWHLGRLRVERNNKYWLVKSRSDFCTEIGITLDQYKRAMPELHRLDFIESEIGLFKGKTTPHIRLTDKGEELMLECYPKWSKSTNRLEQNTPKAGVKPTSHMAQNAPSLSILDTYNTTETTTETLAMLSQSPQKPTSKLLSGKTTMKTISSSAAILAGLKIANGTSTVAVANTSKSAQSLWRRLVPKNHASVGMMPELTMQKKGQVNHIVKALPEYSDEVFKCVIPNWVGYCKFVAGQAGLSVTPDVPDIGFLLKYVGEAGSFTKAELQLIAPKPKLTKAVKVVEVCNSTQTEKVAIIDKGDEMATVDFVKSWKPKD